MDKAAVLKQLGPGVRCDYPLSGLTSFKVGGPADFYAEARSEQQLARLVRTARRLGLPVFILGNGSNVLPSDKGIRGLVVRNLCTRVEYRLSGSALQVEAEAGAMLPRIGREAIKQGFFDLVYATGIPGTVGGAVMSNAGAYGWCMANNLTWVRFLAGDATIQTLAHTECELSYRHSRFKSRGEVVLAAGLELRCREPLADAAELNRRRRASQPLTLPNAGSMFKNPPDAAAGFLIEQAGLKGYRIGNAQISAKHANFIVNLGGATARDVRALVELARSRVNTPLELEVQLVGEWDD